MIKLEHVNKYFNKKKENEIRAIDDTSITLPDSGLVTFLGNSGCGKTTLLNAIGGLDNVDSGEILLDDESMTNRGSAARDELRNASIGYIFQNYNLIEDATVFANVALALRMTGFTNKAAIEERVMYILDKVGIARYRNRPVTMLSGGERQRVGIARAIVKNPKIIIADEPTGNLDSTNTIEIMNIIKAISREKLVILVTHERKIAEFYADRIIEIVDGRITSDRMNEKAGSIDYRVDNKLYLGDMKYHENLGDITLYADSPDEIPPIRLVVKNGNLYIDTGDRLAIGQENVEMLEGCYEGLSRDVMDKYEFEYEDVYRGTSEKYNNPANQEGVPEKAKYKTIYGPGVALKTGFRKIAAYSRLKKILLLGFVLASMFIIYAISNVLGVHNVTEDQFLTSSKDYLSANVGIASLKTYERYAQDPSVDYVLPGAGAVSFAVPIDDYEQAAFGAAVITATVEDKNKLTEENLVMGRLPESSDEVVIDTLAINAYINDWTVKEIGINTVEDLMGRKFLHSPYLPKFTVVGICDTKQPCVYVDKDLLVDLCVYDMGAMQVSAMMSEPLSTSEDEFVPYTVLADDPEKYLVEGRLPEADYEVLAPDVMKEYKDLGEVIDKRVNGNNLKIVGFYHDERGGYGYYTTKNTAFLAALPRFDTLTICPYDKESAFYELDDGEHQIKDVYESDREEYVRSVRRQVLAVELMAVIIIIISLIEIYLILRASFLSRIKEVGVLRAVGLKKADIYRMFAGEVLAITILTAIPGMIAMAYVLHAVSSVTSMYRMNIWIFLGSLLIVTIFNLIGGLLPVFNTLRKTPAEILARNDVN